MKSHFHTKSTFGSFISQQRITKVAGDRFAQTDTAWLDTVSVLTERILCCITLNIAAPYLSLQQTLSLTCSLSVTQMINTCQVHLLIQILIKRSLTMVGELKSKEKIWPGHLASELILPQLVPRMSLIMHSLANFHLLVLLLCVYS